MCGIAGLWDRAGSEAGASLAPVLESLRHRGPDAAGTQQLAPVPDAALSLAACRLAILDPSPAAGQPFRSGDGRSALVYNGEVYNFADLRALPRYADGWRTRSDTEVVARLLARDGHAALSSLRGMFALAWAGPAPRPLLLARDRIGIKPLYWTPRRAPGPAFASELRALLRAGLAPRRLRREALDSYLATGSVVEPWTAAEGVESLPAGAVLEWGPGPAPSPRTYWQPPGRAASGPPAGSLPEILRDTVRRHLVSDRPVGVFLSGGLDSAGIAAVMRALEQPVVTITVPLDEGPGSDVEAARETAAILGTDHREVALPPEGPLSALPAFLDSMDQPTADGLNTWLVARAAKEAGLVVCLSGLGADELFGGYDKLRQVRFLARLARVPGGAALARLLARYRHAPDEPVRLKLEEWPGTADLLTAHAYTRMLFTRREREALIGDAPSGRGLGYPPETERRLEAEIDGMDPLAAISWLEMATYMRNTLLRDTDVFTMAHSIEGRVPYCDHVLVEHVLSLPARERPPGKGLLRRALAPYLPKRLLHRPKKGFVLPLARWLQGPLGRIVEPVVCGEGPSGLRVDAKREVWSRFLRMPERMATRAWALFVLEEWCRRHAA
ncbi:MAG: asparagine synthase (glutamine-hydrolyzing) [Planctomycetales bacterium]|nr:asparagine synthase (glutamine-hydrolyzing) [Planctomycetales bacterium]